MQKIIDTRYRMLLHRIDIAMSFNWVFYGADRGVEEVFLERKGS